MDPQCKRCPQLAAEVERLAALFQQTHGVHHSWVAECQRLRERVAELERATSGGRLPGCICTWEEGDSPCPLHGHLSEEAETEARAALKGGG